MITARTPQRIDGRDQHGDRWTARLAPDGAGQLVAIRTPDGEAIHLSPKDAHQLAGWLFAASRLADEEAQ